jgi:hypothetical protein
VRVKIATQSWGTLWKPESNPTRLVPDSGRSASISTDVFAASTGSGLVGAFSADAFGVLPGWVEIGSYTLTVNGVTYPVEAVGALVSGNSADDVKALGAGTGAPLSVVSDASGNGTADFAVVKEAPLNVAYKQFGAKIDNATDDAAAWAAAVAALPAAGGEIFQPHGVSKVSAFPSLTGRRNVRIIGEGSNNDAGGFGSTLIYTGTGSGAFIDATKTVGFGMEGFNVLYGNVGFTGYLFDFRNASGSGANDTRQGGLKNCVLSGQTGTWTSPAALVCLANAVNMKFGQTTFLGGAFGVIGRVASTDYSNGHIFDGGCKFQNNLTAHVKNAGETWLFDGPIIEGLTGN